MIRILMICLCAMVFLFCLYVILIQNFTESKRKTQDRVMGLVDEEERNKSDKKKGKLNLKIKKEKKKVSVFATTHKKLQLLEEELYNLGMKMPVQTFVTLWVAITIGLPTIMMMLGVYIAICIIVALIAAFGPLLFIQKKKKKRKETLESQLIEGITVITNALKAGHSFQTAMGNIAVDMEGPMAEEFGRVTRETQRGMTLEASFNSLWERIGSDDLEMLCQTILIQRKVGGNLTEVLDKISETIRNRLDLKEEIKTLTSSGKISGYIIGALPVILLVLISMINPVYARPLFNTVIGNILLLISVILEVIGFIMINKVVDIKY